MNAARSLTAREEAYIDKLATLAGRLAAVVEWCVENDGETLFDNPHQLASAKLVLADARAFRDAYK
jgi:hypothetical protein